MEITVTAQRHLENAQKVPISVAPITPDAALNAGAVSTDMLAQLIPGVQMGHEIDSATTFIRGIGPIRTEPARKARSPCISMTFTFRPAMRPFSAERHFRD